MKKILLFIVLAFCITTSSAQLINPFKTFINVGTSNPSVEVMESLSDLQAGSSNKIWSIQSDIDLGTSTINIPSNVTLSFSGGSITNGTISWGAENTLIANPENIFSTAVTFTNDVIVDKIYPEWFGASINAVEDYTTDTFPNRVGFQKALDFAHNNGGGRVFAGSGRYEFECDRGNGSGFWDNPFDGTGKASILAIRDNTILEISPNTILDVDGTIQGTTPDSGDDQYWFIKFQNSQNSKVTGGGTIEGNGDEAGPKQGHHCMVTYGGVDDLIIENITTVNFSSDGLKAQTETNNSSKSEPVMTWESGGINKTTGADEVNASSVRNVNTYDVTLAEMTALGYVMGVDGPFSQFDGVREGRFNIYFYGSGGAFIESRLGQIMYDKIPLPSGALTARIAIDQTDLLKWREDRDTEPVEISLAPYEYATNVIVDNVIFDGHQRQGISVTGFQDMWISNCTFKNISGNPGAAIDFEDARYGNKRVNVIDNQFYNNKQQIVLYNVFDANITGNNLTSRRGDRNKDVTLTNGISINDACRRVLIADNVINNHVCNSVDRVLYRNNKFRYSLVTAVGGEFADNEYLNSMLQLKQDNPTGAQNFDIDVHGERFFNRKEAKAAIGLDNSIRVEADLRVDPVFGQSVKMRDIFIKGEDDLNSVIVLFENAEIDGLTLRGTSSTRLNNKVIDNVDSDSEVAIWYVPSNTERTEYKNWNIRDGGNVRFRGVTDATHDFYFENLSFTTSELDLNWFPIDFDNIIGELEFNNLYFQDPGSTSTAAYIINIDNTAEDITIRNSKFVTGVANNLIDIGSSTNTGFKYINNIFENVVLNERVGDVSINNIENGLFVGGTSPANTTVLDLSNPFGTKYVASANAATTYTFTGASGKGFAKVLINAASQPTVTGATLEAGSTFASATDMYMVVYSDDGTNVNYYFLEK